MPLIIARLCDCYQSCIREKHVSLHQTYLIYFTDTPIVMTRVSTSEMHSVKHGNVELQWQYTLNTHGGSISFISQEWSVRDTATNQEYVVAEARGNRAMQIRFDLPISVRNRYTMNPSNQILTINNLEYNDSMKFFQSTVFVGKLAGHLLSYQLVPVKNIIIQGEFLRKSNVM